MTPTTTPLARDIEQQVAGSPAWLQPVRRAAYAAFQAQGIPTRRAEAWKYTDIGRLGAIDYPLAGPPPSLSPPPSLVAARHIVLVNGHRVAAGPQPEGPAGLTIGACDLDDLALLGSILTVTDHPYVALNAALFDEGLTIRVAAGCRLALPIELLSIGRGGPESTQFHSRVLIDLADGAEATLIERHQGLGTYFSNLVIEVRLAAGATLHHVKLQDESAAAVHLATVGVTVAERASYRSVVVQLGGKLGRHEVHGVLAGDHADLRLNGAVLAGEGQHLDNTTHVLHQGRHGTSQQVFKTVLDGNGHGVFLGTVVVGAGAQKTDARQLSRTLMLSERAAMDAKPELLIFADDVKCSHGATVGDIDAQALFYLRSRGLDERTARHLLTQGFLVDVVDTIADEGLRAALAAQVAARLGQGSSR